MTRRLTIVAGILVLLTAWTHARPRAADRAGMDAAALLPLEFAEWVGRDAPPLEPEVARVLAADRYVHRYYASHMRPAVRTAEGDRVADVEADVAYYAQPQAGAAMHSPLNCLPGSGWQIVASSTTPLDHGDGTAMVRRLVVARGLDRIAMIYWFQNRSAVVGNEYRQRLQLVANGLRGRPTDAALVRVMGRDTEEGREAMERFARHLARRLSTEFK